MDLASKLQTYDKLEQLKSHLLGLTTKLQGLVNGSSEEVLKAELGEFYPLFEEYVKTKGLDILNTESIDSLLRDLSTLKILEIELAFNPTSNFITRLHNWLTLNVTNNLVCKLSENRNLLGGAVLTLNGKYADYSSRKKLDVLFSKDRIKI